MSAVAVRFHRLAINEYLKAYDRYAQVSVDLANSFKEKIDKSVAKLQIIPTNGPSMGAVFVGFGRSAFPISCIIKSAKRMLKYWPWHMPEDGPDIGKNVGLINQANRNVHNRRSMRGAAPRVFTGG